MKRLTAAILTLCLLLCACGQSTRAAWQEQYDLGMRYLDEGNLAEARRAEIQFHRELARVTDNPLLILLQDFIETLLEKIKAQLSPDRAFSQHSLDWHSRVIEALERQDADSARRAMLADLASVEADLLKLGAEKDKINWK